MENFATAVLVVIVVIFLVKIVLSRPKTRPRQSPEEEYQDEYVCAEKCINAGEKPEVLISQTDVDEPWDDGWRDACKKYLK